MPYMIGDGSGDLRAQGAAVQPDTANQVVQTFDNMAMSEKAVKNAQGHVAMATGGEILHRVVVDTKT